MYHTSKTPKMSLRIGVKMKWDCWRESTQYNLWLLVALYEMLLSFPLEWWQVWWPSTFSDCIEIHLDFLISKSGCSPHSEGTSRQSSVLQSIKATKKCPGSSRQARLFHGSHPEARHMLPYCRCVTSGSSPWSGWQGWTENTLSKYPPAPDPLPEIYFRLRTP